MNTPDQDSRHMFAEYAHNHGLPYPPNHAPWEWLVAVLDMGWDRSAAEEAVILTKWIEFVKDAHTNKTKSGIPQVRGDGTPYYYHPIRVAMLAAEHFDPMGDSPSYSRKNLDWDPLCYALFGHDLFEDTTVTRDDIISVLGKRRGEPTCDIIEWLTKPPKTPADQGSQDAHLRYTVGVYGKYIEPDCPDEVAVAKSFDRLHNLKDMRSRPLAWRRKYLEDTSLLLTYLHPDYDLRKALELAYWREMGAFWNDKIKEGEQYDQVNEGT
jgi:(p)ppGpp synthase/HD superfamily hydrolase